MKFLSGISVVAALLIAGAATPSFATSLAPGGTVLPNTVAGNGGILALTGVIPFSFGGDTGNVIEYVTNSWSTTPFAGDITFVYQIQVTGGNIVNLTSQSFSIPGLLLDVQQENACNGLFSCGTLTPAISASWTSNGQVVGFGFTPPDGLSSGMTGYELIINTNLTTFEPGAFSLQDGQTANFQGFVPAGATPEPSTLSLLGTGLLAVGAGLRRKMLRK